jgi:exodeoxyribonuclease VII large subunit
MVRCAGQHLRHKKSALKAAAARFGRLHPEAILARWKERLAGLAEQLCALSTAQVVKKQHQLVNSIIRLKLLSPENTLRRGYSITMDAAGKVIRDAARLSAGDELRTRFQKGEVKSRVK